jgi:hypothetical protein
MVVGIICLQASAMKCIAVRRLIFILDALPSNSPFITANAFRYELLSVLASESMDDPHISGCKWLVQFEGKNIT